MNVHEIPQELIDIIDERAGKKHSREGRVLTTLAEILTKYDEIRKTPACDCYHFRIMCGLVDNYLDS